LAVNERRKSGDEWVDETTFVDVTLWGRNAEVANEYTQKGNSVMIEGRLKFESWENEGQKRSKLKVVADRLQLLGGKPVEQKAKPAAVPAASEKYDYQDPPF
jgi:single-strand DNA-binding protein